jgi:hypothetical protein
MSIFAVFRFIPVKWGAVGRARLIISAKGLINAAGPGAPLMCYVTVQMDEVAVPRQMCAEILSLIARQRAPLAPACPRSRPSGHDARGAPR